MANSSVAITAGSGTPIDVELAVGGDARQVVVIGDPSTVANVVPVVAKGTQGAFGLPAQQFHNAGRVLYCMRTGARTAGVTTEAMFSMTSYRGLVSDGAATTKPVTAAKTIRLIGMTLSMTSSAAALGWARVTLRGNPSGACIVTDPVIMQQEIGMRTALANQVESLSLSFGADGIEFSGAQQFGVSQIALATTVLITASLWGYEY